MESNSGVPHLHAAVCRMDEDGKINNDHNIHLRAQWAAERVAKKRGVLEMFPNHRAELIDMFNYSMSELVDENLWK